MSGTAALAAACTGPAARPPAPAPTTAPTAPAPAATVVSAPGLGSPSSLPWYPTSPAYEAAKNNHFAFDLDKAKSLLDQSGLSNVHLDYDYPLTSPEYRDIGQILQADLARIGVTLTLKPNEPAPLTLSQRSMPPRYQGISGYPQPFGHVQPGVHFAAPSIGPLNNYSGYRDDSWTARMTQMANEIDPVKQKQVYSDFNDSLLDLSMAIFVATQVSRAVTPTDVRGATWNMALILDGTEAWLA